MALDNELTLEAVRRAHREPREVTADRALLVALILGPSLAVLAAVWQGLDAKAEALVSTIEAPANCGGFCAAAAPAAE